MKRLNRIARNTVFYCFNDLPIGIQEIAFDNLQAEDEYWDLVEQEADDFIRDQLGRDIDYDWHYNGDDITIYNIKDTPDKVKEIEKIFDDIKYDVLEILDGNNETVDRARFNADGTFVGFI